MPDETTRRADSLVVAITGASGLIGTALSDTLLKRGHSVIRMVRHRTDAPDAIYWSAEQQEIDAARLDGVDAMIHLAGEPIFSLRWTDEKKRRIRDSRVLGTRLIARTLADLQKRPRVFISASAIGIYGDRNDERLTENSPVDTSGFLASVCAEWEAETAPAADAGIRTVNARNGLVLSRNGGLIELLLPLFKMGLGGQVGNGKMYMSWIAQHEVVAATIHCLEADLSGPVNMTAPEPVTMGQLTDTLGSVLHRPTIFRMPAGIMRAVGGSMADEMILSSARVLPTVLQESGFTFRYTDISHALEAIVGDHRS